MTRIPSLSLSVSTSHLCIEDTVRLSEMMGNRRFIYLGLSGRKKEPPARIAPITHCANKGILHDISELINEQK